MCITVEYHSLVVNCTSLACPCPDPETHALLVWGFEELQDKYRDTSHRACFTRPACQAEAERLALEPVWMHIDAEPNKPKFFPLLNNFLNDVCRSLVARIATRTVHVAILLPWRIILAATYGTWRLKVHTQEMTVHVAIASANEDLVYTCPIDVSYLMLTALRSVISLSNTIAEHHQPSWSHCCCATILLEFLHVPLCNLHDSFLMRLQFLLSILH